VTFLFSGTQLSVASMKLPGIQEAVDKELRGHVTSALQTFVFSSPLTFNLF
jgi:hypothetical protein